MGRKKVPTSSNVDNVDIDLPKSVSESTVGFDHLGKGIDARGTYLAFPSMKLLVLKNIQKYS